MTLVAHPPDSSRIRIIDQPATGEPPAPWPDAPRYAPDYEFPAYRFVPGLHPHPVRDENGHSYGRETSPVVPINAVNWRDCEPYLTGIDLYHNGYLWEAHEEWEGLWSAAEDDSLDANFLRALILNGAALLKAHQCNPTGARAHSQAARWRLARLRSRGFDGPGSRFFGVDIAELIQQIKRHYAPLWESTEKDVVRLRGDAPRILIER